MTQGDLRRKMVRAAQARSALTMLSGVLGILLFANLPMRLRETFAGGLTFFAFAFGVPWIVCIVLTRTICHKWVKCPQCDASLWGLGSGSFKPRRMRIKPDTHACPHCHMPIPPS
jgi:hypothetical protein